MVVRPLIISTSDIKATVEMSLRSFAAMPAIVRLIPFAFDGQPLVTECYSGRESRLYEVYRLYLPTSSWK